MASHSTASDYAGFSAKNLSVYYGYEETTTGIPDQGEWCFVAKVGGKEILRVPQSQLKADRFEVGDCLLAGLGILFDTFRVEDIELGFERQEP
jgi:hypothetical protein